MVPVRGRRGQRANALYCPVCGGVLLDEAAQRAVLGNVIQVAQADAITGERPSPVSEDRTLHMVSVGDLALEADLEGRAVWFDAGKLVLIDHMIRKASGASADIEAPDDLVEGLVGKVWCADCSQLALEPGGATDAGFGLICRGCPRRDAFPKDTGRWTHAGVQFDIKIEGARDASFIGQVDMTWPKTGRIQAKLWTPGFWAKLLAFFGRRGPTLGRLLLDQSFWVETSTPDVLDAWLATHGVRELLLLLAVMGQRVVLDLSPGGMRLVVRGWSLPENVRVVDPTLSVETLARRLADRWLWFHDPA